MEKHSHRIVSGALAGVLAASLLLTTGCGSTAGTAAEAEATEAPAEATAEPAEATAEPAAEAADAAEETGASDVIYYPDTMIQSNLPDEQPTAAEDFYLSVNYDFIKNTAMPEGLSRYIALTEVSESVKENMVALLGGTSEGDEKLDMARTLYADYLDTDGRNAAGWDSVKPYVEAIESADTVEALLAVLTASCSSWDRMGYFGLSVGADSKNSSVNVIYLQAPSLYLQDSAEYTEMTESGELYKSADDTFFTALLAKYGYSDEEISAMLEEQFRWETKLAEHIDPTEVSYREDYQQLIYNPYTADELTELAGSFPIADILDRYGAGGQEKYVVYEPDYIASLASLVTEENLPLMKAAAVIDILVAASSYTDEEAFGYRNDWVNTEYGSTGMKAAESRAYDFLCSLVPELTGDIYAENFFSEDAKADMEEIFLNVRAALRARLEQADWMSEETRSVALEKLDALEYHIAYPTEDFYDYSVLTLNESDDLFTTVTSLYDQLSAQALSSAGRSVNREAWGIVMSPNTVNACYEPTTNSVYFPAAILQAPFYDEDYSLEQKYGSIGAVMGHELTHAFDSNTGSQYDKDGNMVNWWTDEDRAAFTSLTSKVGERYGSYATVDDMRVNGDLTIGETVADLGGMAASLDALELILGDDADYAAFFTQNARIWRGIETREQAIYRLKNDPHAPPCLRVNVNAAQFEQFYEAFGIQEGDPMYTAPENRLCVW